MQTTLDAIIGENQSAAIKNNNVMHIFHHSAFSIIDVSHKLNSNLAWISLSFRESFTE